MSITPQELSVAERVARRIGSKWPLVETEDLTSHLYLWLATNPNALERWRTEDGGEGKLYVALRREAAKYCAHEQAERVGRPLSAGNYYNAGIVSRALPFIFEETPQTTVMVNPVTGHAEGIGSEFDLAITIVSDIRSAFYDLPREVRAVIEWRFRDGLTYEEIGELKTLSKVGAKKQVDRAVSRIVDALGGERLSV